MKAAEKELAKTCAKLMKWCPGKVMFQKIPEKGFILKMAGDSEMVPTIGVIGDQLIGSQDDFDMFLELVGYEAQTERVLFDPERRRFIMDAGWTAKFWKLDQERENFVIDTIGNRVPSKVAAIALALIAAVSREGGWGHRATKFFGRLKPQVVQKPS